jgi:hypothetical protein
MKIGKLFLIFQRRERGKEKSSNFAAEIHSRNGLILFHRILVVALSERDTSAEPFSLFTGLLTKCCVTAKF